MSAKNALKAYLDKGTFNLEAERAKLDTLMYSGTITPDECEELKAYAQSKADSGRDIDVNATLLYLLNEVKELRALHAQDGGGGEDTGDKVTLHREYVVGTPANNGDKFSWKGVNYTVANVPDDHVCVWSPEGYPAYWQRDEVQPDPEE